MLAFTDYRITDEEIQSLLKLNISNQSSQMHPSL